MNSPHNFGRGNFFCSTSRTRAPRIARKVAALDPAGYFLADDMTEAELLAEYPGLTHEDVLAAIAYGAEAARERIIPVPTENAA